MPSIDNESMYPSPNSVYQASRRGDSILIQTLLVDSEDSYRHVLLEWKDRKGRTPLIIAAQKGHLDCVLELLNLGANVHHISNRDFGGSALHEAVYYKWRSNGIVEALIRHGANPFVRNAHNRTALDLAMIGNASRDLYIPWLISFDRYGFFAEELMVKTAFMGREPTWVAHWVTVVPVYNTSDPQRMRCLRKKMILYDGCGSRKQLSCIDLKGARAELTSDQCVQVTLGADQPQPLNVASFKTENDCWCISLNATFHNGLESLHSFIFAVNHSTETIIEQSLEQHRTRESSENIPPIQAITQDAAEPSSGNDSRMDPRRPLHDPNCDADTTRNTSTHVENTVATPTVGGSDGGMNINDGVCVVCLDRPQNAGFLHSGSVHRCVCLSCAFLIYLSDRSRCPICRQAIERIVSDKH